MKRSTRRLVSLLICLAMALTILPVAALAAGTTTVYCQAPAGWTSCYIHYWGGAETTWPGVAMSQDANGIWYYEVPNEATGLLFHNNSGTQTTDLTPPTDDNVQYVLENQYWKPYGLVEIVVEYFVAGSDTLCGVSWDPGAAQNKMTENADGTYSITYTGVAAGSYELKVTTGSWATCWGEAGGTGNYILTVENDDSTVVVSFDPAAELVSTVVNPVIAADETLIAEGTATFATDADAFTGQGGTFIPAADGTVTVDISACDPGFYLDVYKNGEWIEEHLDSTAQKITISVSAGAEYEFLVSSASVYSDTLYEMKAGSVTYKITANVAAGELAPGGDIPGGGGENSEENPQAIVSIYGCYLEPGQTMWFLCDNYEHMMTAGVYSQMLYISAGVPYSVTYRGMDVPVETEGVVYYVSYEMMDILRQGKYLFSVKNDGSARAFFNIEVKDRPAYIVSDYTLVLGDNVVVPDANYDNTLYEFTPEETGVYTFTISEGVLGDWGTVFNPTDNTETKVAQLQWTCTAEGQSILVGVAQTEEAMLTVAKTGEYEAEEQVPETVYENTYGFDYQLPENPELVLIDVLDDKRDEAILDKDGFYRYGSKNGPLMVTDLSEFPINLEDAILNGQLRAYVYGSDGKLTARNNYNDAMSEYLEAGLVPVTQELAMMLSQLGKHHGWWLEGGFVFEDAAPADEASAWMVACSYIKGSELKAEDDDNSGSNNQGGSNQGGNNQGGSSNPKTSDISMMWAVIAIAMAGTCLVVLKKKESFFLN